MAEQAFNHFPEIAAALQEAASKLVRDAAFKIQGGYQTRVAVDTGAEKNAAYVVTSKSSDYEEAVSKAASLNPKATILPQVAPPTSATEAIIADAMEYAAPQEFGTVYMPAHPAMVPAVEAARPGFNAALKQLFDYANRLKF